MLYSSSTVGECSAKPHINFRLVRRQLAGTFEHLDDKRRSTIYFFQTFLVMDIVIGIMHYREQIQLLSGWIHHIFYFGLLSWLLYYKYGNGLCIFLPLEIPTTVLSLGHMNPEKFRNEIVFTLSFFIFRIVYNAAMAFVFYQFTATYSTPAVYIPAAAVLLVHCYWFYGNLVLILCDCFKGGVKGMIKKYSHQTKEVNKSSDETSNEMTQLHKRKKPANSNEQ